MPSLSRTRRSSASRWSSDSTSASTSGSSSSRSSARPSSSAQQPLVEGQRGGPALGDRGVALVHERGDVAEQQRLGEGRGSLGVDVDQAQPAVGDPRCRATSDGQVVDVLQHLAERLQDDRERRVARRRPRAAGPTAGAAATAVRAAGVAVGAGGPGGALAEPEATMPSHRPRWSRSARARRARRRSARPLGAPDRSPGMRRTMPSSVAIACASTP